MTLRTASRRTVLCGFALMIVALGAPRRASRSACADDPPPAAVATARPGRQDLARRLVALEESIRARPDAFAARRRATAEVVSRATMSFFGGAFGPAIDALGEARAAIEGAPWDPTIASLARVRVEAPPVVRLDARGRAQGEVRLVALGAPPAADLSLALVPTFSGDEASAAEARALLRDVTPRPYRDWASARLRVLAGRTAEEAPGRRRIEVRIARASSSAPAPADPARPPASEDVRLWTEVALVTADAPARLAVAKAALATTAKAPDGTPAGVRPTLERLARRVEDALAGRVGDVVPDVADELRRLEEGVAGLVAATKTGAAYVPGRAALSGDSHRATADGRAYRLYAPPPPPDGRAVPLPLVVALHGAGGNEDMYFEAYGAGEAKRLAIERGFVLASPESASDAIAVAEDVRALLDLDPKRVHLTGHSLGAVSAWSAAAARPDLWASVAPVSGGGIAVPRAEDGKPPPPPVFAVAGELDFGRGLLEATAKRARSAGVAVETRIYGDLDHLLVVQVSLPDVFAWLEAHPRP